MSPSNDGRESLDAMIREVMADDTGALRDLLGGVDAFRPEEVDCALDVVADFLGGDRDYQPFILWEGDRPAGYVCFGKVPLTQTTYDLYWIAVGPGFRRRGYGRRLMEFFIDRVRQEGGRLAVSETSSLPGYADARKLYIQCGFQEKARLEGYYREGDDLIIYTRSLAGDES
ncbi:MAG: GNAT family N-acetyltransferase [Planctomycetota bacterium]|nr:GNAT family N-acetyltransferase [Planctomycetota bacterium]